MGARQPSALLRASQPVSAFDEDGRLIEAREGQTVGKAKVAKAREFFPPVRVWAFELRRRFLRRDRHRLLRNDQRAVPRRGQGGGNFLADGVAVRLDDGVVAGVVANEVGRALHSQQEVRVGVANPRDLHPGAADRERSGGRGGGGRAHRLGGTLLLPLLPGPEGLGSLEEVQTT